MTNDNFDMYGIGQRDGTSFVMPTSEVDGLMETTGGNPRALEKEFGLPDGTSASITWFASTFLSREIMICACRPAMRRAQMISGYRGGFLPRGVSEAVIDGRGVPSGDMTVSDMDWPAGKG